jgi:hypothetical protein
MAAGTANRAATTTAAAMRFMQNPLGVNRRID